MLITRNINYDPLVIPTSKIKRFFNSLFVLILILVIYFHFHLERMFGCSLKFCWNIFLGHLVFWIYSMERHLFIVTDEKIKNFVLNIWVLLFCFFFLSSLLTSFLCFLNFFLLFCSLLGSWQCVISWCLRRSSFLLHFLLLLVLGYFGR